jgi:hypothetical protein
MKAGSAPRGMPFEPFKANALEVAFRNAWTDNADAMSILYSGTPALKTDFTRNMKRTYKGELQDGYNSVKRYFINNFYDGYNHDCLDLWQKKLTPTTSLNNRANLSSFKLACFSLVSLLVIAHFFLHRYFPFPEVDPSYIDSVTEYASQGNLRKTKILHQLVYLGVLLVGITRIMGKCFHCLCS